MKFYFLLLTFQNKSTHFENYTKQFFFINFEITFLYVLEEGMYDSTKKKQLFVNKSKENRFQFKQNPYQKIRNNCCTGLHKEHASC